MSGPRECCNAGIEFSIKIIWVHRLKSIFHQNRKPIHPLRVYTFNFIASKNGPIRTLSPTNRGRHTHVHRSELNSDRWTWVCRPRFIGLNDRIGPLFDPIKVGSVYSQGVYWFSILMKNGFEPMNPYNFSCWIRFRHSRKPEMGQNTIFCNFRKIQIF